MLSTYPHMTGITAFSVPKFFYGGHVPAIGTKGVQVFFHATRCLEKLWSNPTYIYVCSSKMRFNWFTSFMQNIGTNWFLFDCDWGRLEL